MNLRRAFVFCSILAVFGAFLAIERWTYPNLTTKGSIKIYDKNKHLIYEFMGARGYKREVALNQLPQNAVLAVLATEDKRFYNHPGIDPLAIIRAVKNNLTGHGISGASTITQQLVRKVSFSEAENPNKYLRKIREIITALRLERIKTKDQILEMYLNEMYFGNRAYGIESAANIYFNKSARNLTLAESVFLSAIIASPYSYDPISNYETVKSRQEQILLRMKNDGLITDDEMSSALGQAIIVDKLHTPQNTESYHFADYVLETAKGIPRAKTYIENGESLIVTTTIDLNKQKTFFDITKHNLKKLDPGHNVSNAALVLLNNKTGAIESMIGGVDYFDTGIDGSINMTQALRQPGSAIKPAIYVLAFSQDYYPSYVISDEKKMYVTKNGDGYIPQNYDNVYHGNVNLRTALASSLNAPAVELVSRLGVDKFITTASTLGIKSYNKTDYDLAIALGGGEVTLLDLTNMYATIARSGNYLEYYAIEEITNDRGDLIYRHEPKNPKQVLGNDGPEIAYLVTDILSDPKARMLTFGEKNLLNLSKKTAVKTGTTSNWHDVWTVGYNKTYTLGVWAGNNDHSPMIDISGVTGAAPIWNAVFEKIYQSETYEDFDMPENIESRRVCRQTGLTLPCQDMYSDLFIKHQNPDKPIATSVTPNLQNKPIELEVINPRQNAVFKLIDGVLSRNGISFEARAGEDVDKIVWILDGQEIATTSRPFSYIWTPKPGRHTLKLIGTTGQSDILESVQVTFELL